MIAKAMSSLSDERARECGVKIIGDYYCTSPRSRYMILEAENQGKIEEFLKYLLKVGVNKITPVESMR